MHALKNIQGLLEGCNKKLRPKTTVMRCAYTKEVSKLEIFML